MSHMKQAALRLARFRTLAGSGIGWWSYFGSFGDDFFSDDDD
jgi:hypothetical protein